MSPDENYLEKRAKEEEEKLHRKVEGLSHADRTDIYEKGNDRVLGMVVTVQGVLLPSMWRTHRTWPSVCSLGNRWLNGMYDVQHGVKFVCFVPPPQVWSCWRLRVKPRTPPVCQRSECLTSSQRYPSSPSRRVPQVRRHVPTGLASTQHSSIPACV